MKYTAIVNGDRLEIELIHADDQVIEAETGGRKYVFDIRAVETGVYWLQWQHRSIDISVTPNGDSYAVTVAGKRINVEVIDARSALRKTAHQGQVGTVELRAPMPGRVVKVLVREGSSVELNQGLVVIEAMKMQNEIKAPKKGTVRKLGVKETAAVNAGDLLVIVE